MPSVWRRRTAGLVAGRSLLPLAWCDLLRHASAGRRSTRIRSTSSGASTVADILIGEPVSTSPEHALWRDESFFKVRFRSWKRAAFVLRICVQETLGSRYDSFVDI